MTVLRRCLLAFCVAPMSVFAADPALLALVMPDAKVLAGLEVGPAKASRFGQYILSRMQPDDPAFVQLTSETGFDPLRDLTEVVIASNWEGDSKGQWLVIASGSFNAPAMAAALTRNGGAVTSFQGVNILSPAAQAAPGENSVIAFLDTSRALMGDADSVQAAIARFHRGSGQFIPPANLGDLSAKYDFWFVTLVPVSEFAGFLPDANMNQALQGNLFQAILQANGGVKFGAQDTALGAEFVTRTEKDAAALADVMKFLAGLLQANKGKNQTATQVSALLDTIQVQATGTTVTMALTVPEASIEQILDSATTRQRAKVKPPAAPVQ